MLINKDKLFVGGAALAAGYIGASLLGGIHHHAAATPGCGTTVPGKGFFCCTASSKTFVKDRATCCASDPNADPNSCPKPGQPAPGFSAGILDPIAKTLGGTPSAAEQKKAQPTSAGGTCTLPSQDQDCCDYWAGEQVCVAGKSLIKGVTAQNLTPIIAVGGIVLLAVLLRR